jgi:hypothetical protein
MAGNDVFSLILMSLILMGIAVFVSTPLLQARTGRLFKDQFAEAPMHHLLSRKDSIYMAIKDLEFDYSTGKLSEEDYQELREKFALEASDVLREIDELSKGGSTAAAEPKGSPEKNKAKACSDCGFKIEPGDSFCQSCGTKL